MHRSAIFSITTLSALCLAYSVSSPASAAPFLPVPPASFLNYHVSTARGLSEEVAQDVVVRGRLARHFGLSGPAMVTYVQRNLVETTLTARQAGQYRVACISPSGRDYFVTERLAAGTPVFALAGTHKPILKLVCGNPLVSVLPYVHDKQLGPAQVAAEPTTVASAAMIASNLPGEMDFIGPTTLDADEFSGVGPISNVGGNIESLSRGGGLFPLIGALAAGIATIGGHHSNSNPPSPSPPASTPEPSSVVALGMGLLGIAGLRFLSVRGTKRSLDA